MLGDHGVLRLLYDNTRIVAPGKLWRSYQPSPHKLKIWRDMGARTIINLRGDKPSGFYFLEEEACEALGLELVTFRVFSREAPSKDILHGARALFRDIAYPAVMHCKSGADRTGLMATLYRFFEEGRPLPEAMDHLSLRYGHVRQGKTGVIDYAFERYIAHARENEIALDDVDAFFTWVDSEAYDPQEVKADFMGSWWGNLLTEKILRRE